MTGRHAQHLLLLTRDEFRQGIDKGAESPEVFVDYGSMLEYLGKVPDAIRAYSKGLEGGAEGCLESQAAREARLGLR